MPPPRGSCAVRGRLPDPGGPFPVYSRGGAGCGRHRERLVEDAGRRRYCRSVARSRCGARTGARPPRVARHDGNRSFRLGRYGAAVGDAIAAQGTGCRDPLASRRIRRVGLRAAIERCARHQGAVRRSVGHRKDDGGRGHRARARIGPVQGRPVRRRQQIHRRDGEKPRSRLCERRAPETRCSSSTKPTRSSESGRK